MKILLEWMDGCGFLKEKCARALEGESERRGLSCIWTERRVRHALPGFVVNLQSPRRFGASCRPLPVASPPVPLSAPVEHHQRTTLRCSRVCPTQWVRALPGVQGSLEVFQKKKEEASATAAHWPPGTRGTLFNRRTASRYIYRAEPRPPCAKV